jgi:hypothetical protein
LLESIAFRVQLAFRLERGFNISRGKMLSFTAYCLVIGFVPVAGAQQSTDPGDIGPQVSTRVLLHSIEVLDASPAQVVQLLDLLHEIDADQAIDYFTRLASELKGVTRERPAEDVTLGTREAVCRPRFACGEVQVGAWYLTEGSEDSEEPHLSPCHRVEMLHDPEDISDDPEFHWIHRQPKAWRALYDSIRFARANDLPDLKKPGAGRTMGLGDGDRGWGGWLT